MTKEQKFKKAYAKELLSIAQADMESTEVLYASAKGRRENICFFAQQVVEKSIKAILCHLELPVPFTHNLDILIDRIPEDRDLADSVAFNELNEYATIRRYEEGVVELDQDDLEMALNLAKKAVNWAQSIIK